MTLSPSMAVFSFLEGKQPQMGEISTTVETTEYSADVAVSHEATT